jgi:predicted phage terminase large subunit-like protein
MITHHERVQSRLAISRLASLLDKIETAMERGIDLPPDIAFLVGQVTQSDDLDSQHNAIDAWLESTKETYLEKLRFAAVDSLSCFAEVMNPEEPPAAHHDWMCQKLELVAKRQLLRLMISMPPGYAKSTYCSHLFPAWYLGKNPNHKYIQAGHTQEFVDEEFGKRVRANIDSETFRTVFPEVKLDPGSRAAARFAIAGHRGKYLGRGVGQGISGFRANVAAVDDPFASRADAESQTIRKGVYDWFMADLTTRLLPRSPLLVVMTRWHTDDLGGRLEELSKKGLGIPWEVINLPAIADGSSDPMGRIEGEPLWPDFYDLESLLNLRATLPPRDWNSLYMGKPLDAQGGAFKSEWIARYENYPENETDESGRVTKINIRRVVVSVDTASKTNERNDYTAITVWIEDAFRKHYLVDVIRERLEFDDMVKKIEDTVILWNGKLRGSKVAAILVEDKGSGTQYIQTRRDKAPAPVISIEVGLNSKEFRFDGVTPMFEAGEVMLPSTGGWLPDYERELLGFPSAVYDDQVDSTSQYLAWARLRRRGGTAKVVGVNKSTTQTTRRASRQQAFSNPSSGRIAG